ncbi:GNAT family N-acetyltransferase [Ralstonia pickettii]|nr:GNAT family N-acetyltransferase [Ralstonia pickettii]
MKFIPWDSTRLTEIVTLWNHEIANDFPMRNELFKQNSFDDENVYNEGSQIVVDEDDNVIGFIVAKRWQEKLEIEMAKDIGWIQSLLVDNRYRNQGIGSKLLHHAEAKLKTSGIKNILLGRDPWHYFPGIPTQYEDTAKWFEKRGYKELGKEFDLIRHYAPSTKSFLPFYENVTFSILEESEKDDLIAFLHRCFPGRWEYEAIHYFEKGGTGREFAVIKKHNQIIGFCRINDAYSPFIAQNVYWAPLFKEELGGVGPLGVDPEERGNGYGLAIVEAGIYFLRERNIHSLVIDWTGLVNFYEKLGFDVWKSYVSLRKDV